MKLVWTDFYMKERSEEAKEKNLGIQRPGRGRAVTCQKL